MKKQKPTYKQREQQFHRTMNHYAHPIQASKHKLDQSAQLGQKHWRETVQAPKMTKIQAMKEGGRAFQNNVSVSSKLTVIGLGIMLVIFCIAGMFF